ncbi:MAG: hypothetical protein NC489_32025 [Ruminococcus flavefaciens]|nr:hypothetical protein [Ruminococcus flavefaciens]
MADCHYIRSDSYTGYVTCCGKGCPACAKAIRLQPKLFIPMYVLATSVTGGVQGRIQFWDRTMRFQPQLVNDVFRGYPNPSEYIFRITRHGAAGDINTTYDIRAISNNTNPATSYDAICSTFGASFPDYYNTICKDVDQFELGSMMTSSSYGQAANNNYGGKNNYGATPRGSVASPPPAGDAGVIPGTGIPYTGSTTPGVSLNAPVPDSAPDPSQLPFNGPATDAPPVDPDETNDDIDMTNLSF